ncbi:MAG: rod shape-determining protein MreD [Prevotella sp.]|jgi:rod shape-determining protein MreD|nr:rod shape-determining protein MreD [Prevotella sp.]
MNISFLKRLLLFLGLLVAQVLVLNHIHLFGYAVPLLYIYFVISFQRNYPRWAILVWSFLLGLGIDVSSNTPGLAAASMTLMGLLQPYVLELFMQRDSNDDMQPAIFSFGPTRYLSYAAILTGGYCLVFFTLESFTFFNWLHWLLSFTSSTVLTLLLIMVIDNLRKQ